MAAYETVQDCLCLFSVTAEDIGEPLVWPHLPKPVRGGFREIAETLLALTQGGFGAGAGGDIPDDTYDKALTAFHHCAHRDFHGEDAAVAAPSF